MIYQNLSVTRNPMELVYTKRHRVLPIQAPQRSQDCTQQRGSHSGEQESETKKRTEFLPKHQHVEQESTSTVKTIYEETYSKPTCSTSRCSTQSNHYSTKSITFTAWKIHCILTFYKSQEQLTASQSSKVNFLS